MYINRLEISIVSFSGIESIGSRVQVASRVFFEDYFICSFHSFLCTCFIIRRERPVTGMFTVIERFDTAGLGLVSKNGTFLTRKRVGMLMCFTYLSFPSTSCQRTQYLQSRQKVHDLYVRSSTTLSLSLSQVTPPSPSQQQTAHRLPTCLSIQPTPPLKKPKSQQMNKGVSSKSFPNEE